MEGKSCCLLEGRKLAAEVASELHAAVLVHRQNCGQSVTQCCVLAAASQRQPASACARAAGFGLQHLQHCCQGLEKLPS